MAFKDYKYGLDSGSIVFVRVDDELEGKMGTAPEGAATIQMHAIINGSRKREFGIHPRGVSLSRTLGTAPNQFKKYKFIPVLTSTAFSGEGFSKGAVIQISSVDWTVVDQVSEETN